MNSKTLKVTGMLLACAWLAPASVAHYVFLFTGNFPGALSTGPQTLNARRIVGVYVPLGGTGVGHGYVQNGKSFRTLEPANTISSFLEGINDHDAIVGGYCDTNVNCGLLSSQHGLIYRNGVFTTLDYPKPGFTLAAGGINNLGQIVGGLCHTGPNGQCPLGILPSDNGFLWDKGVFTIINFPGARMTQAYAINDLGQIVGDYSINNGPLRGFLLQSGIFTTISFPDSQYTLALGINNSGIISGTYTDQQSTTHGFLYCKGAFRRVDVPKSSASALIGIDNRNEVIADANVAAGSLTYKGVPHP